MAEATWPPDRDAFGKFSIGSGTRTDDFSRERKAATGRREEGGRTG